MKAHKKVKTENGNTTGRLLIIFMLFEFLFLNSKSTKNKRKKLRDNIVSDEDLSFPCGILFCFFFNQDKYIFYFCLNIKTLSSI